MRFLHVVLALCLSTNATNAETLAEMLRRMDRELQELRALVAAGDAALAAIPKGAVVPFRLVECPHGWEPLEKAAGRTIIGAGEGEDLTERALGERGGEETHRLTADELPELDYAAAGLATAVRRDDREPNQEEQHPAALFSVETVGAGKPHNNMQPWIALLYCEKQ